MFSLLLLLPALVAFFMYKCFSWRKKFKSLLIYSGPPTLPIIGNLLDFGSNPVERMDSVIMMDKTYGPITKVLFGPKDVVLIISDPDLIEFFVTSPKHITKSPDYDVIRPWLGQGLITSTGPYWHRKRKILTPTFHFKILEEFVPMFHTTGEVLVDKLRERAGGQSFDIYPYLTLFALDTICETAMGTSINAQTDKDNAYLRAVKDFQGICARRAFSLWKQFDCLFSFSSDYRLQEKSIRVLHDFSNGIIQKRRQERAEEARSGRREEAAAGGEDDVGTKKKVAFLDLLLDSTDLTDEEIREEVDTFMFAGHDTTTSGLAFVLYELSRNPEVQERAVDEIRAVLGADTRRPITHKDLAQCKYLEAVIKEAQRLYPPVPLFMRQLTEDATYDDVLYPEGLVLVVFTFGLHRREGLWKDATEFRPERFLEETAGKRHPFSYLPFSAGPRNCIGQKFAMLELKTTVAKLLLNFELLPSEHPYPVKKFSLDLVLKSEEGVFMAVKNRNL